MSDDLSTTTLKFGAGYDAAWLVVRHEDPANVVTDLAKVSNFVKSNADTLTPLQAVALAAKEAQAAWNNADQAYKRAQEGAVKAAPKASKKDDTFDAAVQTVKDKLGATEVPPDDDVWGDWGGDEPTPPDDDDVWGDTTSAKSAPADDVWGDSPTTKPAETSDVPSCAHGKRNYREGDRKDGTKWKAYFCGAPRGTSREDQCDAVWLS
jgi:hypothetical protein